jgi:hypothetical protein
MEELRLRMQPGAIDEAFERVAPRQVALHPRPIEGVLPPGWISEALVPAFRFDLRAVQPGSPDLFDEIGRRLHSQPWVRDGFQSDFPEASQDLGHTATNADEWIDAERGIRSTRRLRGTRGQVAHGVAMRFVLGGHQTKALKPVMARPTTSTLISRVPS